jgi:molecular chaperone GrpE
MGEDEKRQAAEPAGDPVQDPPPASEHDSAPPASEAVAQEDEKAPPSPEDRIQELAAALAEAEDRALRQLAETENIRRRFERERAESLKYAASGLARDLLNVADNLYRALKAVPDGMRDGDDAAKNFLIGVEMTEKELIAAFQKHGIRRILPVGETFSHKEHQAMFEVEGTGKPAGTVVELMQPGYIMHDRLLRPAMVGVAKGDPEAVEHIDSTV